METRHRILLGGMVILAAGALYFGFQRQDRSDSVENENDAARSDSIGNEGPAADSGGAGADSEDAEWEAYVEKRIREETERALRNGETPPTPEDVRAWCEEDRELLIAMGSKTGIPDPDSDSAIDLDLETRIEIATRWSEEIMKKAREANPGHVYSTPRYPPNTARVHINQDMFSMRSSGSAKLTEEQTYLLAHHGIVPAGVHVVYVDENENPLPADEKPRLSWQKHIEAAGAEGQRAMAEQMAAFVAEDDASDWSTEDWLAMTDIVAAFHSIQKNAGEAPPQPTSTDTSHIPRIEPIQTQPFQAPWDLEPDQPRPEAESGAPQHSASSSEIHEGPSGEVIASFFTRLDRYLKEDEAMPIEAREAFERQVETYRKLESGQSNDSQDAEERPDSSE